MKFASLAIAAVLLASPAAAATLSTSVFPTDGGCEGQFFDVTATGVNGITITAFEAVITGTQDVNVYYRPGGFGGFENTAAGWTLLGTQNIAGGSGFINTLYTIDSVGSITVPPGQTYGFLIYSGFNGTGVRAVRHQFIPGGVAVADADASLTANGCSFGGDPLAPFDGSNADRAFRGSIIYTLTPPIPTLSEWAMIGLTGLIGLMGVAGVLSRRRRA